MVRIRVTFRMKLCGRVCLLGVQIGRIPQGFPVARGLFRGNSAADWGSARFNMRDIWTLWAEVHVRGTGADLQLNGPVH